MNQKEQILQSAYSCITEKGYANSSMRDIARKADVTLSQIHYYFGSKKELFSEVLHHLTENYLDHMRNILQDDTKKDEDLFTSISTIVTEASEDSSLIFDFASLSLKEESFGFQFQKLFKEMEQLLTEQLRKRSFKIDAKAVSKIAIGTILGASFQSAIAPDQKQPVLEAVRQLSEVLTTT
ncbi:MAG: TetR/AcrR family transcriptional regulator [Sphaerochaetaceae bacterium]|nr:TetR/AcrR family transcriptional regulator [Sphaerochaetaceae bacterium]